MRRPVYRDHLIAAFKAASDKQPGPVVPAGGELILAWFMELSRARSCHSGGPNPISFADIEAYGRLMRWPLEPRHVELIIALDKVWLESFYSKSSRGTARTPAAAPINPQSFDAVFR